jgi:lysophospholipase L1-like esterase
MNIKMLVLLAALATSFTATGSATAGPDSAKCALAKGGARVHGCWRPRAATTTRNGDPGQAHYYLSLGDSLAQGFQPNGDLSDGYADQLYASLHSGDSKLVLAKLGCGGETTATMIDASLPYEGRGASHFCGFPHGSQLAEAISFLRAHRGFVSLVTTDIGANDILTSAGVSTIEANLLVILAQLRDAAGPDVPIVGMTDYDPFLAEVWFSSFDLARPPAGGPGPHGQRRPRRYLPVLRRPDCRGRPSLLQQRHDHPTRRAAARRRPDLSMDVDVRAR